MENFSSGNASSDEFEEWDASTIPSTQEMISQMQESASFSDSLSTPRHPDVGSCENETLKSLMSFLGIDSGDELALKTSLQWVKEEGCKLPLHVKVPLVLGTFRETVDTEEATKSSRKMTSSIWLHSGENSMLATLTPNFVKKYGSHLAPGCAIGLKNCSIIRSKKRNILVVRRENFACLASKNLQLPQPNDLLIHRHSNGCCIIKEGEISTLRLSQEYQRLESEYSCLHSPQVREPIIPDPHARSTEFASDFDDDDEFEELLSSIGGLSDDDSSTFH